MDLTNFKPAGEYILVESHQPEAITKTGIIILPQNRIEKPLGKVLRVGAQVKRVEAGDTFFHTHFFGIQGKIGNKKVFIMRESDVIGKF